MPPQFDNCPKLNPHAIHIGVRAHTSGPDTFINAALYHETTAAAECGRDGEERQRWRVERGGGVRERRQTTALRDFWPAGKGRRRGPRRNHMLKQRVWGRQKEGDRQKDGWEATG